MYKTKDYEKLPLYKSYGVDYQKYMNVELVSTEIRYRIYLFLYNAGIRSLGDLLKHTPSEIMSYRGFNKSFWQSIEEYVLTKIGVDEKGLNYSADYFDANKEEPGRSVIDEENADEAIKLDSLPNSERNSLENSFERTQSIVGTERTNMTEIKCPNCGKVFTVDPADFDSILKQIRDGEFNYEVEEKVSEAIAHINERHEFEQKEAVSRAENTLRREHEKELRSLREKLQIVESEKVKLDAQVRNFEHEKKLAVVEAVNKVEEQKNKLEREFSEKENKYKVELATKDKEYIIERNATEEKYKTLLAQSKEEVELYKDMKTRMSTKMVGESLEQHCEIQFNQLRPTAFKNAYFEKDNDARSGSKGDYIYRENDEHGNEIVSIMFEMKNESDTTATKHKNEDFFKELDKDRKEKNCEYAVLVSLLEGDSELYNAGIVDVSYKYDKMYVVRPQCFIPMITLLRNAALNALSYKQELAVIKNQNIDVTNFEENLMKFKDDFSKNYELAHNHFDKAIDEIDKTIAHLQKVKAELVGSDKQLRIATSKVDDVSVKKLTKDNPTMREKFEAVKKNKEK